MLNIIVYALPCLVLYVAAVPPSPGQLPVLPNTGTSASSWPCTLVHSVGSVLHNTDKRAYVHIIYTHAHVHT